MLQKQSPAQSVPYLCFGNSKAIWIWSKNCSFRPSPLQFLIATAVLTWLCNFRMQGEESLLSSLLGAPSWIARHTPLPHPVMNLQKHKWPVVVPFPSFVIQDRAAWAARTSYRPQSEQHKPKGQMCVIKKVEWGNEKLEIEMGRRHIKFHLVNCWYFVTPVIKSAWWESQCPFMPYSYYQRGMQEHCIMASKGIASWQARALYHASQARSIYFSFGNLLAFLNL